MPSGIPFATSALPLSSSGFHSGSNGDPAAAAPLRGSPSGGRRGGDWSRSAAFAADALPIGGEEGEHHDFGPGLRRFGIIWSDEQMFSEDHRSVKLMVL